MSDVQRENGHVDIANKLIDSLIKIHLSGREWQIMMVIFRQTWGYCELKDGKPQLVAICELYGIDWKQYDDGVRTNIG